MTASGTPLPGLDAASIFGALLVVAGLLVAGFSRSLPGDGAQTSRPRARWSSRPRVRGVWRNKAKTVESVAVGDCYSAVGVRRSEYG